MRICRVGLAMVAIIEILLLSGCASVVETVVAVAPQASSPFLTETLGAQPQGWLTIVNTTPLILEIIIYGTVVIKLNPGESVTDTRRWEPLIGEGVEVPVLVKAYNDSGNYIGVANRIFRRHYSSRFCWSVAKEDINLTSSFTRSYSHSSPSSSLNSYFTKFPREMLNGTTALQIINNTGYDLLVRVNGVPQGVLSPSEILYQKFLNFSSNYWRSEQIQISVIVTSSPTRSAHWSIWVHPRGVYAYQWIIDSRDL